MRDSAGAIVAAALSLPGVIAHAQGAPDHGEIAFKYLRYHDSQPGLDRIKVNAPSIYVLAPLSREWAAEGSFTADSVSGATPRYHSAISGATMNMSDERRAGDVKVTRYLERSSLSVSVAKSKERDYDSTALAIGASLSSDDNNRTWNMGVGRANDKISSTNSVLLHASKGTTDVTAGVTQALSPNDLAQLDLTYSRGRGYFSDPYKAPDVRPDRRDQRIALLRWNHHFTDAGASLRSSYRYYSDTFGITAHTLGAEWVQPIGAVTVTPSLRLYTQSAATFYYDPVYDPVAGEPFPPGYFSNPPQYLSPDQRLSAFGAVTVGLKLAAEVANTWTADLKVERYEQRSKWRLDGEGSPGIAAFKAVFVQVGLSKGF